MKLNFTRKIVASALIGLVGLPGAARELTPSEALQRASDFQTAQSIRLKAPRKNAPLKLSYTASLPEYGTTAYYVFDNASEGGFVIVSGDDRLRDVLGYSSEGEFDIDKIPANMKWWLDNYKKEIAAYFDEEQKGGKRLSPRVELRSADMAPIEPMVTTKWNQDAPFNDDCPSDAGGKCVTGCVATAMAQVINYHKYPQGPGQGSYSYTTSSGLQASFDFSATEFDWDNMLDVYTDEATDAQKAAVAELMYACGVGLNMSYSSTESGAFTFAVPYVLTKYFNYNGTARFIERDGYLNDEWEQLVYSELAAGRPMVYSGRADTGGHAFVCDGYDGEGLFHINWGWGGYYDDYFALSALNPAGQGIGGFAGGYNSSQAIVAGIEPMAGQTVSNGMLKAAGNFTYDENGRLVIESVFNIYPEQTTYSIGLLLTTDAGEELGYVNGGAYQFPAADIAAGRYSGRGLAFTFDATKVGLDPGTYRIYPAYAGPAGEWERLRFPVTNQPYILVIIADDGTATYINPGPEVVADVSVLSFTPKADIYKGSEAPFYVAIKNNDTSYAFNGTLYISYYLKGEEDLKGQDGLTISIEAGGITDGTVTLPINLEPGEYVAVITDETGKNIGAKEFSFTVLEGTAPVPTGDLQVLSMTPTTFYKGYTTTLTFTTNNLTDEDVSQVIYFCICDDSGTILHSLGAGLTMSVGKKTWRLGGFHSGSLNAGKYELVAVIETETGLLPVSLFTPIDVYEEVDGVWYGADKTSAFVVGHPVSSYSGNFTIPATVKIGELDLPVTSIYEEAFTTAAIDNLFVLPEETPQGLETAVSMLGSDVDVYVPSTSYEKYSDALTSFSNNVYSKIDRLEYRISSRSLLNMEVGDEDEINIVPIPAHERINPNFNFESDYATAAAGDINASGEVPVKITATAPGEGMLVVTSAQPGVSQLVLPLTVSEKISSSLTDINSGEISVSTNGQEVTVSGVKADGVVTVFALNGVAVASQQSAGAPVVFTLTPGSYIVSADGKAFKVII